MFNPLCVPNRPAISADIHVRVFIDVIVGVDITGQQKWP